MRRRRVLVPPVTAQQRVVTAVNPGIGRYAVEGRAHGVQAHRGGAIAFVMVAGQSVLPHPPLHGPAAWVQHPPARCHRTTVAEMDSVDGATTVISSGRLRWTPVDRRGSSGMGYGGGGRRRPARWSGLWSSAGVHGAVVDGGPAVVAGLRNNDSRWGRGQTDEALVLPDLPVPCRRRRTLPGPGHTGGPWFCIVDVYAAPTSR